MGEILMEPRLQVHEAKGGKSVFRLKADVVVVGSGAGGATAALKLSEKGLKVIVLEEGGYAQGADFTQRPLFMTPRLYRDAASQLTRDGGVTVLQGRTVGGSTTINMGDASRVEEAVLSHWEKVHGWEMDEAAFRPHEKWAWEKLEVQDIPDNLINRNNRMVLESAAALGWQAGVFQNFRKGCIGSGYCMAGCAYDAKRGVMLNLLPEAVRNGAQIWVGMRATRLMIENGRVRGVAGVSLHTPGYQEKGTFEIQANQVVLSLGAMHTGWLLAKSGHEHPALGKNLTLQPQVPFIARFKDVVHGYRGVPQSVYVSAFDAANAETGLGGYRMEPVFGQPETVASGLFAMGHDHADFLKHYNHLAMALLLVPDQPVGSVSYLKDRFYIHYVPTQEYLRRALSAVSNMSALYLHAGAEEVVLPLARGLKRSARAMTEDDLSKVELPRLISAHPQGTCQMGSNPEKHVVDLKGRVRGLHGVRVMDASLFPSSAAHHNTLPIIGLSSYLCGLDDE